MSVSPLQVLNFARSLLRLFGYVYKYICLYLYVKTRGHGLERDGRVTGGVAGGREKNRNDIKAVLMYENL